MAEELKPNRVHVVMFGLTDEDKKKTGAVAALIEDATYFQPFESLKNKHVKSALDTLHTQGKVLIVNGEHQFLTG
jgi:hypothetical protein